MGNDQDAVMSAQVLLKPQGGAMPADAEWTAANVKALAPPPAAVATVTRAFARAGFEVGPAVGPSFSITGRRALFESFFGLRAAGVTKGEVALDALPAEIRSAVAAITFPPPPDFGPGRYA